MESKMNAVKPANAVKASDNVKTTTGMDYALPVPRNREVRDVTVDELKTRFPSKKNSITQGVIDYINSYIHDPEFDGYRLVDSMAANQNAMIKTSASLKQYTDGIRYCAFLHSEDNATQAYIKTFGHRDFVKNALIARDTIGTESTEYKALTSAASRYRSCPLVTEILILSLVPTHIAKFGMRDDALGVLNDKMRNSLLDRDCIAAAKAVLEHTDTPETIKMELDIGVKENESTLSLLEQMRKSAEIAKARLERGENIVEVQKLGITKEVPEEDIMDAEIEDESTLPGTIERSEMSDEHEEVSDGHEVENG